MGGLLETSKEVVQVTKINLSTKRGIKVKKNLGVLT